MLLRLISLFFCLSISIFAYAVDDTASNTTIASKDEVFSLQDANQTLNKINYLKLLEKAHAQDLQNAISLLNKLEARAKKCVSDNTADLEKLSKITPTPSSLPETPEPETEPLTVDQKYLDQKKQDLTNQIADCRLFMIRAGETRDQLSQKLRELLKNRLMYAEANSYENLKNLPPAIQNFSQTFDKTALAKQAGLNLFDKPHIIITLITLLLLSVFVGLWLRMLFSRYIGHETEKQFSYQVGQAFLCSFNRYILLLCPIVAFALFMTVANKALEQTAYLTSFSYALVIYVCFLIFVRFLFYPPRPATSIIIQLPLSLARSLFRRLNILAVICLLTYTGSLLFVTQSVPESLYDLLRTISITLIAINLIWIIWLVQQLPKLASGTRILRFCVNSFLLLTLLTILIAEWTGYHQLAYYLLHDIAITVTALFITWLIYRIIKIAFGGYSGKVKDLQQKLKEHLGLRSHDRLLELYCLRIIIYFILWMGLLLFLMRTWGLGQTSFQSLLNALMSGFKIANFDIIPSRIIIGLLFFISLTIATRFLKTYVISRTNQHLTLGNRESLAAIVGYIGFAVAILIGLLVAGVNFSGLAIIAGALSVGIGFGLQSIVGNFVSGIILLIERPIKPGDRIIVGDTEGYVRRVSIRSTHIITTQRSDVIVPNSDLISKQITNYMLYDTNYFVIVDIGIAYGSNAELARDILLEVARDNPQVISDREDYEPTVYFKEFGDSTLNFSLWCLIKDVNLKGSIKSALNFEINRRFQENGIEIAYPHRDINIRSWPPGGFKLSQIQEK